MYNRFIGKLGYRKGSLGFTLIELLLVLIIVGILAVLAIPQYENFKEKAIAAEAINMLGVLKHAQQMYLDLYGLEQYNYMCIHDDFTSLGVMVPPKSHWEYRLIAVLLPPQYWNRGVSAWRKDPNSKWHGVVLGLVSAQKGLVWFTSDLDYPGNPPDAGLWPIVPGRGE
jgi:prepilin-type N-terminal cleavage/methylation domain-containing protein